MKKKNNNFICLLCLIVIVLMLGSSCNDNENNNNNSEIKDIDGNVYHSVTIGTQVWMVENLKVARYRNGDQIPNVTDSTTWINLTTGAYCDYNNNPENSKIYGKLYNRYTVLDNRNIAPNGWHVPSDAEWTILTTYLGGDSISGGKMKADTTLWANPNTGATNSSGFTALPGGYRYGNGSFVCLREAAFWWSTTKSDSSSSWWRAVYNNRSIIDRNTGKRGGFTVRCLKDN